MSCDEKKRKWQMSHDRKERKIGIKKKRKQQTSCDNNDSKIFV